MHMMSMIIQKKRRVEKKIKEFQFTTENSIQIKKICLKNFQVENI